MFQDTKKLDFKLNIELCNFFRPIKCLIIVHKELFADVSRIGLCDDENKDLVLGLLIYLDVNENNYFCNQYCINNLVTKSFIEKINSDLVYYFFTFTSISNTKEAISIPNTKEAMTVLDLGFIFSPFCGFLPIIVYS